ncbi:helix-turn-helix domain-containing protein [Bacillus idriensis]|uniref:Helix-turn-helix domain-containing protein n=1 Tax=Metabacillus idriensis TaxID=324768 RepID=A0A6I2MAQ3_9BACI|nr:helix-turn-helix domain-containing protein [Metabacillus idriensis]
MVAGMRIRQLREERGIPLGLMAHYLNISVNTLLSMERDKTHLTADQIIKICKLLDINRSDLQE